MVLGEAGVVLDVAGSQRQALDEAAGAYFADEALADWLAEDPDPIQFSRTHHGEIAELMDRLGEYLDTPGRRPHPPRSRDTP